jgi:hypothetical protein
MLLLVTLSDELLSAVKSRTTIATEYVVLLVRKCLGTVASASSIDFGDSPPNFRIPLRVILSLQHLPSRGARP